MPKNNSLRLTTYNIENMHEWFNEKKPSFRSENSLPERIGTAIRVVSEIAPHRKWLNNILLSPHFLREDSLLKYKENSGKIHEKREIARVASDHFPVYCDIISLP